MARQILFRGRRVENGEWIYGTGFTNFLNMLPNKQGCWLWCDYNYHDGPGKGWLEISPDSLGQFTGLQIQGKNVFEGDIVRLCPRPGVEQHFVIYWSVVYMAFCVHNLEYADTSDGNDLWSVIDLAHNSAEATIELIGNRFDNPTLMKKNNG